MHENTEYGQHEVIHLRQGWLVWIAAEQAFVVLNGSAWDPVGVPQDVSDAIFSLVNDADPTKKALFSLSGIAVRSENRPVFNHQIRLTATLPRQDGTFRQCHSRVLL